MNTYDIAIAFVEMLQNSVEDLFIYIHVQGIYDVFHNVLKILTRMTDQI